MAVLPWSSEMTLTYLVVGLMVVAVVAGLVFTWCLLRSASRSQQEFIEREEGRQ